MIETQLSLFKFKQKHTSFIQRYWKECEIPELHVAFHLNSWQRLVPMMEQYEYATTPNFSSMRFSLIDFIFSWYPRAPFKIYPTVKSLLWVMANCSNITISLCVRLHLLVVSVNISRSVAVMIAFNALSCVVSCRRTIQDCRFSKAIAAENSFWLCLINQKIHISIMIQHCVRWRIFRLCFVVLCLTINDWQFCSRIVWENIFIGFRQINFENK